MNAMSARALGLVAASAIAAVSLFAFVLRYEGAFLCSEDNLEGILFLLLLFVFSLSVVWLISEAISWLISPAITTRRLSPWLISEMISRPKTTRLMAMLFALGVHFSIGALGWATFSDVPEGENPPVRALAWVPFWILGVLFKVGHLRLCE